MELGELIRRFRVEANDKVEPYFNADEDVKAWLNDALIEACIRGRLIYEYNMKTAVQPNKSTYPLSKIYEIVRIWFIPADQSVSRQLSISSPTSLDQTYYENWADLKGLPQFVIQTDTKIRLVPEPDMAGEIKIEGYRTAVAMESNSDEPEINPLHHVYLIQWALYKAYSVPDSEFFDPNRAALAEQAFTDYFGIRPDSDLRRATREDVPHHVQPFFP